MSTDHVDEYRPVLHGHDARDLEGVVEATVLRPGYKLDLGIGLDVAVYHAGQPTGDDLVWVIDHVSSMASRKLVTIITKKYFLWKVLVNLTLQSGVRFTYSNAEQHEPYKLNQ